MCALPWILSNLKALPCRLAMPAYRDTQGEAGFSEYYKRATRIWRMTYPRGLTEAR